MAGKVPAGGVRSPFTPPAGAPKEALVDPNAPPETKPTPASKPASVAPKPLLPPLPAAGTAAPPVTLTLSGIIGGNSTNATAVISDGKQRQFVKVGDQIAGNYRVQAITDRQVTLAGAEGKLILKMGGSR
jgi:Tfp pilus assembly protein PilP